MVGSSNSGTGKGQGGDESRELHCQCSNRYSGKENVGCRGRKGGIKRGVNCNRKADSYGGLRDLNIFIAKRVAPPFKPILAPPNQYVIGTVIMTQLIHR